MSKTPDALSLQSGRIVWQAREVMRGSPTEFATQIYDDIRPL